MADVMSGDVFDIRDVIARFEELENKCAELAEDKNNESDDVMEYREIRDFLDKVKGYGGDEQWRGDWYPVGFIADSHFEAYAEELAEDCGMIQQGATWPNNCIDWKQAAHQLQEDYSSIWIGKADQYWYR